MQTYTQDDTPMFARSDKVELRGLIDRQLMDVIDACSMAEGKDRIAYVAAVLEREAKKELHRASLITRVTRGNPLALEVAGGESE